MSKILLLIPALVLLALGTEGLYNGYRGRDVVTVPCAQLRQSPPASLNLHVTGCDIDYQGAAYREADGSIEELFLPARAAGASATQPAPLVIATKAPGVLAIAQGVLDTQPPSLTTSVETMQKAAGAAGVPKAVRGLVRSGVFQRLASRQVLSGLTTPLAEDVRLLDLNAVPDFTLPAALFGGGVLLLLVAVALGRRSTRTETVVSDPSDRASVLERLAPYIERAQEPASDSRDGLQPPPIPAPLSWDIPSGVPDFTLPPATAGETAVRDAAVSPIARLPQVMLLNLDRSAGPESIESAPPLGTREEVTARLREVLPDLRIDARGRGEHAGPDHRLTVDLGDQDVVPTVILEARGETGVSAVRWLLETTGWRAFVPKVGRFVDPEALHELVATNAHE